MPDTRLIVSQLVKQIIHKNKEKPEAKMATIKIHGTYPFDSDGHWKRLNEVTSKEAAELTKIPKEYHKLQYMWLNKGYIVLDLIDKGVAGEEMNLVHARAEMETDGEVVISPSAIGMKAVYLEDGRYYLIERALTQ